MAATGYFSGLLWKTFALLLTPGLAASHRGNVGTVRERQVGAAAVQRGKQAVLM